MSDEHLDVHADMLPADKDPQMVAALDSWNKRQAAWKPFKKYSELTLDERIEVEGELYALFAVRR